MGESIPTLDEAVVVSERLSLPDQLRLIGILSERLRSELEEGSESIDMLSLAGLGAEIWRDLDVTAYLEQERASWDSQVRPLPTTVL
jgi:hypothetical protein